MDNENKQLPISIIVSQAETELYEFLKKYPLPISIWELILRNFYKDIKNASITQLTSDKAEFFKKVDNIDEKDGINV